MWPKEAFKNFQSLVLIGLMFYGLFNVASIRDAMVMSLTLILKHYYDSNTSSAKKDETISSLSNSIPDAANKNENLKQ